MSFYLQLPTFTVETKNGSTLYPIQEEAEKAYQKLVKQNIPVEFFRDGILKKANKTPSSFLEDSLA